MKTNKIVEMARKHKGKKYDKSVIDMAIKMMGEKK